MHLIGLLALLVTIATLADAAVNETYNEHAFWRTFKQFQRGPPLPTIKNRNTLAKVEEKWITQRLDNFDEAETRTWQMRYLEMNEFYEEGGPMFIFLGGEWKITTEVLQAGHIHDMVKEHKGIYFYTEHRFYGDSRPLSDLSVESMQYLDIRHALADVAHFIRTIKATYPGMSNSKVFIGGGSYSATMATWFKHDYPDLANAVWASSAPLIAKVDFFEATEHDGQMIHAVGGEACYNAIDNATREYEEMFAQKRGAEVRAMLKICNDFDETNDLDLHTFFVSISGIFAGLIQTQNPHNERIQNICQYIMREEVPTVGLAKFLLRIWGGKKCNDLSFKGMVKGISYTEYTGDIMRQWTYQLCSSTGWFQTSGPRRHPFGPFPVESILELCTVVFGLTPVYIYTEVAKTEEQYGGINPGVEHVYFTQGEVDSCVVMGIGDPERATIIPKYAHCSDFDSISPLDTPELVATKEKIAELVRQWFAE